MTEAETLEAEIMEKAQKLTALRAAETPVEIRDYEFETLSGKTTLSALFAGREKLLLIHNMGQGCRYCTLWADGINGILNHLEDAFSVALVSKDPPDVQRRLAQDRGWRFRMASHAGGAYLKDQSVGPEGANYPGCVVYEQKGGRIFRRSKTAFGPGDLYSPMWHFLSLAGIGQNDWTPQFHYWRRPQKMDDGGENVRD
jgi:predicted dithiol-disulfide oxidoreductase (DUF899 family)